MSFPTDDDDVPPPYTPSPSTPLPAQTLPGPASTTSTGVRLPAALTEPYTSSLTNHLQDLPGRMRAAQEARSTALAARDLDLITLLVPHIEEFLIRLGIHGNGTVPPLAELTLVPAAAVPREWTLSGAVERRREGEVVRVARVEDNDDSGKKDGEGDGRGQPAPSNDDEDEESESRFDGSSEEFNSWGWWDDNNDSGSAGAAGQSRMWWRDERMATRLASYLQPRAPAPQLRVERRHVVQAVVEQAKDEKKGWSWGRRKAKSTSSDLASGTSSPQPLASVGLVSQVDDRVRMTVRGEEVTFRRENEFGVYESLSGFGLVVAVRIKRT